MVQLLESTCQLPADWPKAGAIDLAVHDLPHASSTIEWWYVNSHLEAADGREFSLFASFFRLAIGRNQQLDSFQYAYSLTWAICDVEQQKYQLDSLVDQSAPQIGLQMIKDGGEGSDPLLQKALQEIFAKGNVPLPDRLLKKEPKISLTSLDLDLDSNQFVRLEDGSYKLALTHSEQQISCELYFKPETAVVRHGDQGVVRGTANENMFYYFIPKCRVEGSLTSEGDSFSVEGSGWYDHEFGKPTAEQPAGHIKHDIAWNWLSIQLSNGYQVSVYDLFDSADLTKNCERWAIVIDPKGKACYYQDFLFQPLENWTSTRTFHTYPVEWQLEIPEAEISLIIKAEFSAQEFVTILSKPAFWEGRIRGEGTFRQNGVRGLGFVERSGFNPVHKLSHFFQAVAQETQKSIQALLPLSPTSDELYQLVANKTRSDSLAGLDQSQYSRALLKPIRDVIDRGGKAWRSYALLACIDLVGGNSQPFANWLVWPELLHTGSLIVDDVQDRSEIRRGKPCCHHLYGEAIAINAGNACYFLGQILLLNSSLSNVEKLKIYEIYFETLRAAHAGQAIDIDGFHALMPEVVEQGEGKLLEKRVLAVHRLKSAVPASSLAQLGSLIGKGTPEQTQALGQFFESLGLAFQIVDDVLNLRGFKGNLKLKGEDIAGGKITLPVAKAMSRLQVDARRDLWLTIHSKPTDPTVIASVIDKLEMCGAIADCQQQAEALVESAWKHLDPVVPDSDVKIKLRAFGWYVLARHY